MVEASLSDLLTSIAREARSPRKAGPMPNWYPSDVGSCDRKSVLKHAGVEHAEIDDTTARTFWIGNAIHDSVQRAVSARLPGRAWHEVEVKDDVLHVSGRIDTLRFTEGSEWVVYEYKGVKGAAFEREMPQPQHVLQVSMYLTFPPTCPECMGYACMGDEIDNELCGGAGILPVPTSARLIYISKDDGKMAEFVVQASTVLSDAVRAVLVRLQNSYDKYIATGELPPPLPKVPLKVKGKPVYYAKTGAWGKKGDPKLIEDWKVRYCDYNGSGLCCGDGATHVQGEEV